MQILFGLFTAFLAVICLLLTGPAFKKQRYGLGIIFLLNAFANFIACLQAFLGKLF